MITRLKTQYRYTHLLNDADAFMAENATRCAGRHVAFENMQVSPSNSRLQHSDNCVGRRSNNWLGVLFKRHFPWAFVNKCFHDLILKFVLHEACEELLLRGKFSQ